MPPNVEQLGILTMPPLDVQSVCVALGKNSMFLHSAFFLHEIILENRSFLLLAIGLGIFGVCSGAFTIYWMIENILRT